MPPPSHALLWSCLRSPTPTELLRAVILEWKAQGATQDLAYSRLAGFLLVVEDMGTEQESDAVRDLMDCVIGWCDPDSRLF